MGKTLGPPQVSEETSTWWGETTLPWDLVVSKFYGEKCRTGHVARRKRQRRMCYDAPDASEVHMAADAL
jgi:hypothetical protein